MAIYTHHLPEWKREEVEQIKQLAQEYNLVGLVNIYGIPAKQFQQIRRNLHGSATVKVARNTLLNHAFTELGGNFAELNEKVSEHSALIFANGNPFKLYKNLVQNSTKRVAKAGEIAPEDIVVPAGPTSFKPGPIVGELSSAGIPAGIDGGKVKIKETKTVVKAGQPINQKLADALAKLDIKPMPVGLNLIAVSFENEIYLPEVLSVDEEAYKAKITLAASQAFNLAVNAAVPTASAAVTEAQIAKAVREARNLGVEAPIYEKGVIEMIISKAYRQASALKA
ncbi:MAG TPA: 50S ribosomal protein L10 [Methanocorpusculum sp.]|nr:50S ribosomal protein L10 [Methanocorpusculum sp.]HJJ40039.1 50S ribosomal protein L10 [Methanocorpusculum sp.]HJJ49522.1 50S ribosomal protein L10 [Methanocorpusculum sp.]HJJ57074.1 50S ribosomal protein L10 [Methanocorpusculum sp.]